MGTILSLAELHPDGGFEVVEWNTTQFNPSRTICMIPAKNQVLENVGLSSLEKSQQSLKNKIQEVMPEIRRQLEEKIENGRSDVINFRVWQTSRVYIYLKDSDGMYLRDENDVIVSFCVNRVKIPETFSSI
ncbi:MAG: hypothetical protein FWE01_00050 [Firmicutes bacterium]|nr:hypothetical protein [Bacillota bacterium]